MTRRQYAVQGRLETTVRSVRPSAGPTPRLMLRGGRRSVHLAGNNHRTSAQIGGRAGGRAGRPAPGRDSATSAP